MPNHITNIIYAAPHVLECLMRERGEQDNVDETVSKVIDFNILIPLPDDDDPIYTAEKTDYGNGMVGWSFDGLSPMDLAREKWGTKWNAYDQLVDDYYLTGRVSFNTAWSHPLPVITALSVLHPNDNIRVQYADEDFGRNLGDYTVCNGNVIDDCSPVEGSYEAKKLASQVIYGMDYASLTEELA